MRGVGFGGPLIQPEGASVSINGGAATTTSRTVDLLLFCRYAGEYRLAYVQSPGTGDWGAWTTYSTPHVTGTLPDTGDGTRWVAVQFRAYDLNESDVATDSITLAEDTAVAGSGLAAEYLRILVAASATFQSWVGHSGDAASALDHVHQDFVTGVNAARPYAMVNDTTEDDSLAVGVGTTMGYVDKGALFLTFEDNVTTSATHWDDIDWRTAARAFRNKVYTIKDEMLDLSGTARSGESVTYLCVQDFAIVGGVCPSTVEEFESGDCAAYLTARFKVSWA